MGREVGSEWTMGSTGNVICQKGRLHLVFCCSTEDEMGVRSRGIERRENVCDKPNLACLNLLLITIVSFFLSLKF